MISLIQRVSSASVSIDGSEVAAIGRGLLALVAVQPGDNSVHSQRLLEKILKYRVFPDSQGKMNVSLLDSRGALLLVPQFTLAADTRSGLRPGFSTAATPEEGRSMFDTMVGQARKQSIDVGCGVFGADMQVSLVNDGPITFWLQVQPAPKSSS